MSVALADLVVLLQGAVPARDSVPSAAQYEQAVRDAVADYSRRRPMEKVENLSIVAGTAAYTLPDGFLHVISLEGLFSGDGVIHSVSGLIPVSATYEETYTIAGLTLTFHPAPSYTTTRDLHYAAGHVLNGSDAYPDMADGDARIVLLKGASLCLRLQARAAAIGGEMTEYQIGDERVKRAVASDRLALASDHVLEDYHAALLAATGQVGMRAVYDWQGR